MKVVEGTRRSDRRKGAALILVLIFGITMLALILTLLSLGASNVRSQASTHRQLQMHCVLRAGIADAVNEINVTRLDNPPPSGTGPGTVDPGGDGIGCRIRETPSGANTGIPVLDPAGQVLGFYRATLEPVTGGRNRLTVVAAFPSFADPQYVNSCKVEIDKGRPPFPANAISFSGDTSAGYTGSKSLFEVAGNNVTVQAMEFSVPAVNATDSTTFADITNPSNGSDSLVSDSKVLTGADPNNPGSQASGAGTITNDAAGVLNENTIRDIRDAINQTVIDNQVGTNGTLSLLAAAIVAGGAGVVTDGNKLGTVTLPNGTYRVDSDLVITGKLTGSGTLIIAQDLLLKNEIVWDGNVIIANESATTTDGTTFDMDTAKLTVNGVLALQAKNSTAEFKVKGDLVVNGAFTCICDDGSDLYLDHGAKLDITGIMAMLGEDIEFEADNGGHFNVTGSLAFSVPPGATTGIDKIKLGSGQHNLAFTENDFMAGLDVLGEFFDPDGKILPISATKYWEENAHDERIAQETLIGPSGGTFGLTP